MESREFNHEISDCIILIGRNLRKYRIQNKLTQQELAYRSGNMERSTISRIERFDCNGITLSTLVKLASVLKINLKDLFT